MNNQKRSMVREGRMVFMTGIEAGGSESVEGVKKDVQESGDDSSEIYEELEQEVVNKMDVLDSQVDGAQQDIKSAYAVLREDIGKSVLEVDSFSEQAQKYLAKDILKQLRNFANNHDLSFDTEEVPTPDPVPTPTPDPVPTSTPDPTPTPEPSPEPGAGVAGAVAVESGAGVAEATAEELAAEKPAAAAEKPAAAAEPEVKSEAEVVPMPEGEAMTKLVSEEGQVNFKNAILENSVTLKDWAREKYGDVFKDKTFLVKYDERGLGILKNPRHEKNKETYQAFHGRLENNAIEAHWDVGKKDFVDSKGIHVPIFEGDSVKEVGQEVEKRDLKQERVDKEVEFYAPVREAMIDTDLAHSHPTKGKIAGSLVDAGYEVGNVDIKVVQHGRDDYAVMLQKDAHEVTFRAQGRNALQKITDAISASRADQIAIREQADFALADNGALNTFKNRQSLTDGVDTFRRGEEQDALAADDDSLTKVAKVEVDERRVGKKIGFRDREVQVRVEVGDDIYDMKARDRNPQKAFEMAEMLLANDARVFLGGPKSQFKGEYFVSVRSQGAGEVFRIDAKGNCIRSSKAKLREITPVWEVGRIEKGKLTVYNIGPIEKFNNFNPTEAAVRDLKFLHQQIAQTATPEESPEGPSQDS